MPRLGSIRRSCRPAPILLLLILSGFAAFPPAAAAGDVTLAWDPSTGPGLAGYKIWYGTASGNYTQSVNVGNVTTYTVTGLAPGAWYFAATAYDSAGNQTVFSNQVSAVVPQPDTQPPSISAVSVSNVTASGASISWTTNELSTSEVVCGLTTAYGSLASTAGMATSHTVVLTNLLPLTTYHYSVVSTDAANNSAASVDRTFTTLAPPDTTPPVITGPGSTVNGITVTITWTTNEAADSLVEYGLTTSYGSRSESSTPSTTHSQTLTGLAEKRTYQYRVTSRDAAGNAAVSNNFTFVTGDVTAPVITGPSTSVSGNTVTITWTTNEAADSLVDYGLATSYGLKSENASLSTSHSQVLTGLTDKTTYQYRVTSKDAAGNTAQSANYIFTTGDSTPPEITGLNSSVNGTTVTITWTTNEAADSLVDYGLTSSYGQQSIGATHSTSHAQVLTGLTEKTTYQYRVTSKDVAGNASRSANYTFTTGDVTPPAISGLTNSVVGTTVTIIWTTSEAADSLVDYGLTTAYGQQSINAAHSTSHAQTLTGLAEKTTYQYRVTSTDAAGNAAQSASYAFTTGDTTPPAITGPNSSVSGATVTITWTTDEAADSLVEYGLTTSYGYRSESSTPSTVHSQTLTGLTGNTTYQYRVKSKDADGNTAQSANYAFTTGDVAAPVISAVNSSVNGTTATITWTTDEAADSLVDYGTTIAYGLKSENAGRSAAHSQTLNGLAEGTTYQYRVTSKDAAGNAGQSGNYSFTTGDSTPPSITGVTNSVAGATVTITWTTNEAADSLVEYGLTTTYGRQSADTARSTMHSQTLTGLAEKTTYQYRVTSKDAAGNAAVSINFSFTTGDGTAPSITAVASSVSGTTATITWTTNEAADSLVDYGPTTSYGIKSQSAALSTSHSQTLTGLTEGTTYQYRVTSKDAAGNAAQSGNFTFTTEDKTPPEITAVTSSPGSTSATITWTTNEAADSAVDYGLSTAYDLRAVNGTMSTSHSLVLSGLKEGTTYHYRVTSKDRSSNQAVSADYTFATTALNDVTSGLAAAYGFDEGSGLATADYSPNANSGTLRNAGWSTTAKFGRSLSFNGKNSFVSAGVAGLPSIGTPKTVACWIYMSSKTAAIQSTVVLSNTTQTTSVKQGTKNSQVGAMSYTDMWLVASTLPSTRKWHHLAYVFDGLKHYFYVDGALTATSNQISKVAPVTALDVGRSNPASEYFKGYIDEVRIYSRPLGQEEIKLIMTAPIANLKGAAASAAPRMAISASDASREAELAAEEDVSDVATGPGGPPPVVEVAMTQRSFAVGEIVTAGSYRIGNPSDHGREVELKTWVEGPGLEPVPVWGFGAEEAVRLSARHHEDYGPLGLFDVSAEMPAGTYRFNARAVDPVTGDVLCEDGAGFVIASEWRGKPALERRHAPALLANMEQWRELAVTNAGGEEAAIEVKIWLEPQGRSPIAVLSVGGDGSLVLAPNAAMTFDPLAAIDPPAGSWTVRYRILDPATGRVLMEQ